MCIFIRKSTTLAFVLCDEVTVGEYGTEGSVGLLFRRNLCLTLNSCDFDGFVTTLAHLLGDVSRDGGIFLDTVGALWLVLTFFSKLPNSISSFVNLFLDGPLLDFVICKISPIL